jgi:hypothetical protein
MVVHNERSHAHVHLIVNRLHQEIAVAPERSQDRPQPSRSLPFGLIAALPSSRQFEGNTQACAQHGAAAPAVAQAGLALPVWLVASGSPAACDGT